MYNRFSIVMFHVEEHHHFLNARENLGIEIAAHSKGRPVQRGRHNLGQEGCANHFSLSPRDTHLSCSHLSVLAHSFKSGMTIEQNRSFIKHVRGLRSTITCRGNDQLVGNDSQMNRGLQKRCMLRISGHHHCICQPHNSLLSSVAFLLEDRRM